MTTSPRTNPVHVNEEDDHARREMWTLWLDAEQQRRLHEPAVLEQRAVRVAAARSLSGQQRGGAPLHHHFGLTAVLTACALLLGWVVYRCDGQVLAQATAAGTSGLGARFHRGHDTGARRAGNAHPLAGIDLAALVAAGSHTSHRQTTRTRSRVRRLRLARARALAWRALYVGSRAAARGLTSAARSSARWLLADERLATGLKLGAVLAFVWVVLSATPGGLVIATATALAAATAVLWVHAYRHRGDPINPRPLLYPSGARRERPAPRPGGFVATVRARREDGAR